MELTSTERMASGWERAWLGHLHLHRVAAVLGRERGEEGEVGWVVVGLILASWVLLVRENLTSTSSVAKVGPWLAQLGICLIFLIQFDFYPKCAEVCRSVPAVMLW